MYYKKDLEIFHPQRLNHNRLQLFRRKETSAKYVATSTWRIFWEKTTIHGVRNTSDPTMEVFERVIWFFIVCAFTAVSIYCFLYYLGDFNAQVTRTVVDDGEYNTFKFYFPSIGLCSRNRVNWKKIDEVVAKHFPRKDEEAIETFKNFIGSFEGLRFGKFERLARIQNLTLKSLEGINVSHILEDLSMNCDDVFHSNLCMWKGIQYNCCDLFYEEKTEVGVCLVFNSIYNEKSKELLRTDKFYPYANSRSGEGTGIQVMISIDPLKERPGSNEPEGIWMVLKEPYEWYEQTFFIRSGTETSAIVTPKLTTSDESIAVVPIHKRNCLFDGEDNYEFYKTNEKETYLRKNCITQCHQWYLVKTCNCTISLYFSQQTLNYRECTPEDYLCIYKNRELFNYESQPNEGEYVKPTGLPGMTCPCLRSCNSMLYQVAFNSLPLANDSLEIDLPYSTKYFLKLDIYYFSDVILKYQTYLDVRLVDFLSNIGGLVSLFMGASLTSFTEATYYIFYAIITFIKGRINRRRNNEVHYNHFKKY